MVKRIIAILGICAMCSLSACKHNEAQTNYTPEKSPEVTENESTALGDWYWISDDEYVILSIRERSMEVIDNTGYSETATCEYEASTGYIYTTFDTEATVCIAPISETQCMICYPVGSVEVDKARDFEFFSTDHGDFYKWGIPIYKRDAEINEFLGLWKIAEVNYEGLKEIEGSQLDIQNEFLSEDCYFLSFNKGSVLALISMDDFDGISYEMFFVDKKKDGVYLYNILRNKYFGKNIEEIYSEENFLIAQGIMCYDEQSYILLEKVGETTACYPEISDINENSNHNELLTGTWRSWQDSVCREFVFYSDYSCSPSTFNEESLYNKAKRDGYGAGEWSIVDGMLKITYHTYFDGGGVLYHNYRFIDSNTLIVYDPSQNNRENPIIYKKVI